MSGIVLVVGLAMAAVGAYEMVAGYGDILSERGWSAFIAGAVLFSGGVVTMALGAVARTVDRLRAAIVLDRVAAVGASMQVEQPGIDPPSAPDPATASFAQADLFHEPTFEQAPTAPMLAAAPIEHDLAHEPQTAVEPPPALAEPEHRLLEPTGAEPRHDDWLDHSFAELEREMAVRHETAEAAAPLHPEPVATAEPEPLAPPEAAFPILEPHPAKEEQPQEPVAHEPVAPAAPAVEPAEQAIVSAREAPAASAVIGRYESEGTSYVMYADGSIDAQSEAGVYRFASMAELKTFIES